MRSAALGRSLLLLLLLLTAVARPAAAFYLSVGGGASFFVGDSFTGGLTLEESYDPGYLLSGAAGLALGETVRLEGELAYRAAAFGELEVTAPLSLDLEVGDGETTLVSGLLNVYYDPPLKGPLRPYLGAGLGMGQLDYRLSDVDLLKAAEGNDLIVVYQLAAGLGYRLNRDFDLFADYRYLRSEQAQIEAEGDRSLLTSIEAHSVLMGIRLHFR